VKRLNLEIDDLDRSQYSVEIHGVKNYNDVVGNKNVRLLSSVDTSKPVVHF
jgi:hypothetical protein